MPSVYLFQDEKQKAKYGSKANWSVAWIDESGTKRTKTFKKKTDATGFKQAKAGQFAAGTYREVIDITWAEFRKKLEALFIPEIKKATSQADVRQALDTFERIVKPAKLKVSSINLETVATFKRAREKEPGKKTGTTIGSSTIRKELIWLKWALRHAKALKHVLEVPDIKLPKCGESFYHPLTQQHFSAIYDACDEATSPAGFPFQPADWWRALVLFAMTTGWRISEILALRWSDVNLETGRIVTRAADNKGGRTEEDFLPQLTIDHLKGIRSFGKLVFDWHNTKALYNEFAHIQEAAGIKLDCLVDLDANPEHTCSRFCHVFGFHDLRSAYATENAFRLPHTVLQRKMRHKSFTTTLRYINLAERMRETAADVLVPNVLKQKVSAS